MKLLLTSSGLRNEFVLVGVSPSSFGNVDKVVKICYYSYP